MISSDCKKHDHRKCYGCNGCYCHVEAEDKAKQKYPDWKFRPKEAVHGCGKRLRRFRDGWSCTASEAALFRLMDNHEKSCRRKQDAGNPSANKAQ